jgi:hypothetical protein
VYTHSNFTLRLLTVNYAINPGENTHQLPAHFVEHRVSPNPVLFQSPSLSDP